MDPRLQRAILLYQQDRYEKAAAELRQVIADEPEEAYARSLLGLSLAELNQYQEATDEAERAIGLDPDDPFGHYALGQVLLSRKRTKEALEKAESAVSLDPWDADYRAFHSACLMGLKRWKDALAAAEAGLEGNAEHRGCANLRAMALVRLGRKDEAGATIDSVLADNPEDGFTHANMGWTLLNAGQAKKALEHFKEALRLDPRDEWARSGVIEALKAKNFLYAWMLKYFLWMSGLSSSAQWMFIIGVYFGNRFLGSIANENPEMAIFLTPIRFALFAFIILTWLASPIFNLMLRLDRYGRMVLSEEEIKQTNIIGVFMGLALISWVGTLITAGSAAWLTSLIVFGLFLLPLAGALAAEGSSRKILIGGCAVLLLVGLGAIWFAWTQPTPELFASDTANPAEENAPLPSESTEEEVSVAEALLGFYFLGILLGTIGANILGGRENKR